jgi:ankyrin repeat protein
MLLKVLTITAWVLFAADAFMVVAGMVSPNMGDDAAGRGMAMGFALVGLVFLAIGGAALFFGGRAQSRLAVIGSMILLALPLLLFFGTDLESMVHSMTGWISDRKVGRYPEPAQRELAKAIQAGDPAAMQRILATRPALNARDAAGNDLLGFAVSESRALDTGVSPEKRIEAVRLLLEAGMDPNQARDVYGGSTWFVLSRSLTEPTAVQIFRLFLDHGADPNALSIEGTPVIFDAWQNVDSVRAVLDHGGRIEIRGKDGSTPLLFYVGNGRWDAALLMLDRGADVNVQNENGVTMAAALESRKAISERLQEPLSDGYLKVKGAIERRQSEHAR